MRRFRGKTGRDALRRALEDQRAVAHDGVIARALADNVALEEHGRGRTILRQGDSGNDLYFILSGSVAIRVNNREMAIRRAGNHVGEMALLDSTATRSATVVALEPTIVARVTERVFARVARSHPTLWRFLAAELAERLRQRNRSVKPVNRSPIVFIGSSTEALPLARAMRAHLRTARIQVRLWSEDAFAPSHFSLEDLETQAQGSDFAVLIGAPDDQVTVRGKKRASPRDNVVFELGLFMGAISHERTFLVLPQGVDVKIPSDLFGITVLYYLPTGAAARAVSAAARSLRSAVKLMGPK